jgi:DNA replication initiation complex subunit (GINS family)
VTASEKLKALEPVAVDALEELSADAGWAHAYQPGGDQAPNREPDVRVILDALPQIVAVVEAAQRLDELDAEGNVITTIGSATDAIEALGPALAALDEALS